MRVLVVGSGGREHALAWWCSRDRDDVELIVAPGNGGTAQIAENVPVDVTDAAAVARLARERDVDLVVIGPDAAAAAGVADACIADGIAVFGPTAAAARIESSKVFAKHVMDRAGIRTAAWVSGGAASRARLVRFAREREGRCVVKADGLALGKGVVVCDTIAESERAIAECLDARRFGDAGATVIVEEHLAGREVSVLALTDGVHLLTLPPARDHKRAYDGDAGPNTGGMGAVAPAPGTDDVLLESVERSVLQPCIDELRAAGTPFVGCLYGGMMLTDSGPVVLEFNARFGDPEAQALLPLLDVPALDVLQTACNGALTTARAATRGGAAAAVVAAAAGYPESPRTGDVIAGLDDVAEGVLVFHAGTRRDGDGTLRTSGGRVLSMVAVADGVEAARATVYENLTRVHFEGMRYRHDIGAAQLAPHPVTT